MTCVEVIGLVEARAQVEIEVTAVVLGGAATLSTASATDTACFA